MKTRIQFWLGTLISIFLLYVVVRNIPLKNLATVISEIDPLWLAVAIFFQFLALFLRAIRWLAMLKPEGSLKEAFYAQNIGYLFNNVFPMRVGELARIFVISKSCGISIIRATTSVFLERILDVIMVSIGLLIVLSQIAVPEQYVLIARSLVWLIILFLIMFTLFIRFHWTIERVFRRITARSSKRIRVVVLTLWRQVRNSIKVFSNPKIALPLLTWFFISWCFSVALYWCVMRAFVPNPTVLEAIFIVSVLALSFTVPSSPGYIGVFQFVGQQALVIPFGSKYSPVSALAIALTVHAIFYITTSLLGIIGISRFGISVTGLRAAISEVPVETEYRVQSIDPGTSP